MVRSRRVVFGLLAAICIPSAAWSQTVLQGGDSLPICAPNGYNGYAIHSPNGQHHLGCRGQVNQGYINFTFVIKKWHGSSVDQALVQDWSSGYDGSSVGLGSHQNQWTWASADAYALMQGDGNFVFNYYGPGSAAAWSSSTYGNPGAYLNLQDDGNLVIYTPSDTPIWSSR